jgi:drug/metabolite transporter, DME family
VLGRAALARGARARARAARGCAGGHRRARRGERALLRGDRVRRAARRARVLAGGRDRAPRGRLVAALLAVSGAAAIPPLGPGALRIAAGTLVCGIVASLLFYGGLGRVPAPVASALTYLEPVVAAGVGLVFFDERLGAAAVAGAAVVVASGLWVALERARDGSPVRRSGPGRSPPRGG